MLLDPAKLCQCQAALVSLLQRALLALPSLSLVLTGVPGQYTYTNFGEPEGGQCAGSERSQTFTVCHNSGNMKYLHVQHMCVKSWCISLGIGGNSWGRTELCM